MPPTLLPPHWPSDKNSRPAGAADCSLVMDLFRRGYEIADHSVDHPNVGVSKQLLHVVASQCLLLSFATASPANTTAHFHPLCTVLFRTTCSRMTSARRSCGQRWQASGHGCPRAAASQPQPLSAGALLTLRSRQRHECCCTAWASCMTREAEEGQLLCVPAVPLCRKKVAGRCLCCLA